MSLAESLIADFKEQLAKSRALVDAAPEDKYDWKPHDKSMSLGALASHIAETPTWGDSVLLEEFDFATGMADYKPFLAASRDELLSALDRNAEAFVASIDGKDDAFMTGVWRGVSGDKEVMAGPRADILRSFMVHHQAHHGGQLSVYLRLLDVPVPPTFGPTADNPDGM